MRENYTITEGARISIVDDDESMRQAIETLILSMGFVAEGFPSAEAFLNSERVQAFDCLILDVKMPGLGGLELQRRLSARDTKIPIVFITAHYSEEERARAMQAGAVDFLSKPFSAQELFSAIDASLAIRRNFEVDREQD